VRDESTGNWAHSTPRAPPRSLATGTPRCCAVSAQQHHPHEFVLRPDSGAPSPPLYCLERRPTSQSDTEADARAPGGALRSIELIRNTRSPWRCPPAGLRNRQ